MTPFDAFVGIPFIEKGRSASGCDCWGLLRLVYRDVLGIDLPSYDDRYMSTADRAAIVSLIRGEREPWVEVPAGDERPFDGVLMRERGQPHHIGVVVRPGRVLHVQPGTTAGIENYRAFFFAGRIAGFWRHRDVDAALVRGAA